jgi:hypothetical protein
MTRLRRNADRLRFRLSRVPVVAENVVERPRALSRHRSHRIRFAVSLKAESGAATPVREERRQRVQQIALNGGRQIVPEFLARLDDRGLPVVARLYGGRRLQLQEMLDNAADQITTEVRTVLPRSSISSARCGRSNGRFAPEAESARRRSAWSRLQATKSSS